MLLLNYTKVFKVLSNPMRLELMLLLLDGNQHSVVSLSRNVECSVAVASRQMGMLAKHNLVQRHYRDLTPYYQLTDDFPKSFNTLLLDIRSETEHRFLAGDQAMVSSHSNKKSSRLKKICV